MHFGFAHALVERVDFFALAGLLVMEDAPQFMRMSMKAIAMHMAT